MNTKYGLIAAIILTTGMLVGNSYADTFKNSETGESFNGFMTQKSTRGKTLVYNSDNKELTTINTGDYVITYNSLGRKDNVVVVPITQSEVLLSQVVSETIANAIIEASNKGPLAIILQIDNPGGRGDYMKIITFAITQTKNCPVIAYIDGQHYGGAFSAAAMIAVACDKIFISPTASIGAIGPIAGTTVTDEDFSDYLATYASDSLVSYNIYAVALAQETKRPPLLVRALIDKHLSVEEVENIDKTRDFVSKDDRQPTQNRIRTLAEGMSDSTTAQVVSQAEVVRSVLNLPPITAVEVGLIDGIADSISSALSEASITDAKLTYAGGIDKVVKKYTAARRNLAESLSQIDWLENRAAILQEQLNEIEKQLRTGTVTRQVSRGDKSADYYYRSTVNMPNSYYSYYYDPQYLNGTEGYYPNRSRDYNKRKRRQMGESETITTELPASSAAQVQRELVSLLNDLIVQYRRAMNQAKRWPGSLPPGLPYQALEQNRDSAAALRDYLLRQLSIQQQVPTTQTRINRINNNN